MQQCEPSHTWGPGLRDHFLVHHVISGRGSYTAGGVTHEVGAGDTFIVYPSVIVTYRADDADPWEYCWVGFNGAEAKLLMAQTPFTREKPVVRFEDPSAIESAITGIYRASGTTPASELRAIGLLYLFLALLTEQPGAPAPPPGFRSNMSRAPSGSSRTTTPVRSTSATSPPRSASAAATSTGCSCGISAPPPTNT